MNILGIFLALFIIIGLLISIAMMRSKGDTETEISNGIGTIDEPKI